MVAISLYRGNLHKVPDVPRKWLMPSPKISLKDFKILLRRRSRALSLLTPSSNPPNPKIINSQNKPLDAPNLSEEESKPDLEKLVEATESLAVEAKEPGEVNDVVNDDVAKVNQAEIKVEGENKHGLDKLVEATESLAVEAKEPVEVNDVYVETKVNDADTDDVARIDQVEIKVEGIARKEEDLSEKQKRRQEIEEKLKILNEKKHSLVQALKQIINAEEELKRRSNIQGVAGQPPVAGGQGERTHDSRHNTPRMGSEGNVSGEAEGAETDGANHNVHLRHLVRMSSISPSSDSQQRKSPFTTVALPSRANSGVANSPSRFALAGQQGLPPNLPSVSVSGTNYVASSPSPAASGGTSAFRDRRVPSPWN